MDLKTVAATFVIVFLAELGDKTQLSVLLFASKSGTGGFPWGVLLGACLALIATTAIATVLGYAGKSVIPERASTTWPPRDSWRSASGSSRAGRRKGSPPCRTATSARSRWPRKAGNTAWPFRSIGR